MDKLFLLELLLSGIIFIISLFVLAVYDDKEKRKKAKTGMLISVILFVIGFSNCVSSI